METCSMHLASALLPPRCSVLWASGNEGVGERSIAMKFRCPYCLRMRFQMVPGRIDEARCSWCGKESKITAPAPKPNKAKRAGKPLVRSGRS